MTQIMRPQIVDVEHAKNYITMRGRSEMAARIDALGVDRSAVRGMQLPRWSVEAEVHGERRRECERQEVTMAERMAAYRFFFGLTR